MSDHPSWKRRPPGLPFLLPLLLLAPAGAAAQTAPVVRVVETEIHGAIDPVERLHEYVAPIAGKDAFFVEAGDLDRIGIPVNTVSRLERAFDAIGYHAVVQVKPVAPGQVRLLVHLRAHDRVRNVFVEGNWPLRQDEITRRISIRPGRALPPTGAERDAFLERERANVLEYLRSQGYLEAEAWIELQVGKTVPAPANLIVHIKLGPGYPVGPVTVKGNRALPSEEIAETLRHRDWLTLWIRPLPFRKSLLSEDIEALTRRYRALGYAGARVLHDFDPTRSFDRRERHVRLGIEINERKRIEVAFEGNRRRSAADLRDALTLFSRGNYGDFEAAASVEALAQYYRERGHMLVRVRWRRERVSPEVDRLVFSIDEGPVLKVRAVAFEGNRAVRASVLADVVATKVFPPLGLLGMGEGGFASPRQLASDVERLVGWYQANGYLDARARCEMAPAPGRYRPCGPIAEADDAEWRAARGLRVRFQIEEGPAVRVAEIRFETGDGGRLPRAEPLLRKSLLQAVGAPFRPALLREDARRLKRLLGDEGYTQGLAEAKTTRTGDDRMSIRWQLLLGPQVRVGPVFVRGNFVTRERTILQWVPLGSGSLLTTTAFERGQRNLQLIQLFNNAAPISFPGEGDNAPVVPMLVEVEERHDHYGVVRVGGGGSTEQAPPGSQIPLGVYASLGYEHRNLFGSGWTFVTQGAAGNSLTRVSANFVDPRLLGTLFRLELASSYLRQATVRLGDIRSGGGSIGVAREMYPGVDASLRYNLRDTYHTEFLLRGAGPDEEQQTIQIGTVVGSVSLGVDWVRLDHPLIPTRGFKVFGGLELAHPALSFEAGDHTFLKAIVRTLSVLPLGRSLSLRHSVRLDQGFPLGPGSLLPKVERYFAGGDTTIRGYDIDRARTETIRSPLAPGVVSVQYHPVGGSARLLHNVDLQFPIAPPWYGAVFLDSGMVADSLLGLRARGFRHGAGISPLVIRLPIGDISVSWAWPLDPGPGDSRTGRLHVNVGLMF